MAVGVDPHKDSSLFRHSSRSQHLKPARTVLKSNDRTNTQERKPRAVRPAGRLCTELHRHLTTGRETEDTPSAETEEDDEEEEEEEDEEEDSDSEEEEECSSSEGESAGSLEPARPQFSSEKELHSVVELIKYMHTYCLPTRKQASWDRKEREAMARKAKPEISPAPRPLQNCPKTAPQTNGGAPRPRIAFVRQRELKAHSLLRELLEAVNSFDVSKPYRLHSPPYTHCKAHVARPATSPPVRQPKAELKDSDSESSRTAAKRPKSPEPEEESSFSVRRSRRLASFPSRFAKKSRPGFGRSESAQEEVPVKHPPVDSHAERNTQRSASPKSSEPHNPCCDNEKRSCLCLPLTPKSTGDTQYANKPFEQTLCVELCGTAGLTPPTTPPHKPVEDELFKPEGKGEPTPKGSCLGRAHMRKLPEQTELYAQLRRMGQIGAAESKSGTHRTYGDHDYCLLNLGDGRKRPAPSLAIYHMEVKREEAESRDKKEEKNGVNEQDSQQEDRLLSKVPEHLQWAEDKRGGPCDQSPQALSPRSTAEGTECTPSRSPSPQPPIDSPDSFQPCSPSSKLHYSCENADTCHGDKQRTKTTSEQENDEDKCQVFYIHNLPSSVTQTMLRKRFEALGDPEECKVIIKNEERCGVITFRQAHIGQSQRERGDCLGLNGGPGSRRFNRKRYIDLDEAGPGPVKSKYDALDFDTLLKEAQRSLHR
ncbi:peroxisome proliferator-activated receptor gamma coactivator 1-beta isoform X2 [Chanos chanos]|nr:peroxisome proliferator-activated receptor gamma coactivator 1-beta isoform X2 [Chanos chanos]